MYHNHLAVLASLAVAGCNANAGAPPVDATIPPPTPYAGRPILPIKSLDIGQVYRTDAPNIKENQIVYIKNLCPNDYIETQALSEIAKKYATPKAIETGGGYKDQRDINASAGISGVNTSFLTLGTSASFVDKVAYEVNNVKRVDVDDEDLDIIKSKLGPNCLKSISKWNKMHYETFIIAGAWNAGSLKTTVEFKPEIKADAKIAIAQKFSPGANIDYSNNHIVSMSGNDQYFSIIPLR